MTAQSGEDFYKVRSSTGTFSIVSGTSALNETFALSSDLK